MEREGGVSGLVVFGTGVVLTIFGVAGGCSATVEVPGTNWNVSLGVALGDKENLKGSVDGYSADEVGQDGHFINSSEIGHIWELGVLGTFTVGEQPDAPPIDFDIDFDK